MGVDVLPWVRCGNVDVRAYFPEPQFSSPAGQVRGDRHNEEKVASTGLAVLLHKEGIERLSVGRAEVGLHL